MAANVCGEFSLDRHRARRSTRRWSWQTYDPFGDPIEITIDDLFRYGRPCERRGRRELRARMVDEMEKLFSLRLDVEVYRFRDRSPHGRSREFDIDRVVQRRDTLLDGVTLEGSYDSGRGVSWFVRAGQWANRSLIPEPHLFVAGGAGAASGGVDLRMNA